MTPLVYLLVVLAITIYFLLIPRRRYPNPPQPDSDDDGENRSTMASPTWTFRPVSPAPSTIGNRITTGGRNDPCAPPRPTFPNVRYKYCLYGIKSNDPSGAVSRC
ncbi:hypothetical protein [Hymenobacter volaticus]|uniref:Uncharacterized protein n=1 Tax=Hymenobacter volaticus TaxID=2932254 RepID=A0ABY4G3T0_9BACT|nr:hypothetical protein [Hymenobacter volaticus]UOQ65545.1 hypothetical protein MUN86_18675 [Hymenobacter volaticus]